MEPQLDYLHGHSVESVDAPTVGEDGQWSIRFDGGGQIWNKDSQVAVPDNIVGSILLASSEGEEDEEPTVLTFGFSGPEGTQIASEISLTQGWYSVMLPGWEQGDGIEDPPEDPSTDRVAEGPDEDWKPEGTPDEDPEDSEAA